MSEAFWALARATGVVSLVLFTVTVLLGVLTRSGRPAFGLPRFAVTLVHRNVSLLATVLVVIHVVSLLLDPYAQLRLVDVLVPFLGVQKPFWLGLGTLAFDLVIALVVTGLLRQRLGQRAFRFVHWFSYAMWPVAVLHTLGNGSDVGKSWLVLLLMTCVGSVVASLFWRVSTTFVEFQHTRVEEARR
ncbi:ferric reductase-like transmembrane domain-containing protein [Cellulomonas sp. P24]|uniref:ferric reductase-like transmembrane domain-containing protein n=1 Tax=Cellulomonas sp. P24 TaxID=2885206 RepID=UPI00216B5FBF|nr:ferric reductase-like transmembrane domain-containing protein [Cellulomonas sp. P24]MCR6491552.1 ferric reductase-like transmembrane domain-containing protein [Cellulomonas sp. P24]